jgi:putative ABC transport system permease protein
MAGTLHRKLLRESLRLKGQVATIALVVACGITSFISLRATWRSLEWSRDAYYDQCRFAHVFVHLERAPESVARRLEAVPGVAVVETRVSEEVTVPLDRLPRAAYGRILSLPPSGTPAVNALVIRRGRAPERGRDEVVLLEAFADANAIALGDRVPVVLNGKLRQLPVVGLAQSPEFVYAIRPGTMSDDPRRFAVLWMERTVLAAAFDLDGAFNDAGLRLAPGASEPAVLAAVDRILQPYGGAGAVPRRHQISNHMLNGQLAQLGSLAGMVPLVFLAVTAFLVNMVLGRLITIQRTDIAALKAVGYSNAEVARHYLGLVAVVMVPGALAGLVGGWGLGRALVDLYTHFFRFPALALRITPALALTAIVTSGGAAVIGALLAVRAAVRLPPAEAMRAPAPARYRRSLIERLGLGALAGPAGMMVIREATRRPLRTLMSSLGIAGAIALVVLGRFGMDSLDYYLEQTVRREQRQDLAVAFSHPRPLRAIGELEQRPGVRLAEPIRTVPVRVRHGHRWRDTALTGLTPGSELRRLIDRHGPEVPLPADGLLVSAKLAQVLGLAVGDRPQLERREGDRRTVEPVVTALLDDTVGLQLFASDETVARLGRDEGVVTTALVAVDPLGRADLEEQLRRSPFVIDVSDLEADLGRLRAMNESAMDVWSLMAVILGSAVVFGVVYNNARIALAVRSRELASLRVLGFSRQEISTVLLAGLGIEVGLALPLGVALGRWWAGFFMTAVDAETFRWSAFIAPRTYAGALLVALIAAAISALWVRRSLDYLDLVSVLKTRE